MTDSKHHVEEPRMVEKQIAELLEEEVREIDSVLSPDLTDPLGNICRQQQMTILATRGNAPAMSTAVTAWSAWTRLMEVRSLPTFTNH